MLVPDTWQPDGPLSEIVIRSDLVEAKRPETEILAQVSACGYAEDDIFAIKLALEEAMTNAVRHGNRHDPGKHVIVRYRVTPRSTTIIVKDEGPGFDPACVPDPTLPEYLERPSGRGIMLIRAYMTFATYCGCGNELYMVKVNER